MTPWRDVKSWCLGENDTWGTCWFAMLGNALVLETGEVMSDGEILNAAREIEGLNDQDRSTDRGEAMEAGFRYVQKNGWPGDASLTIASWTPTSDLAATIQRRGYAMCGIALPDSADGDGYDFSDNAMARKAPGVHGHAILVVEAVPGSVTFITWGAPQTVSSAWWDAYARQTYEVELVGWGG